MRRLVLAVAVLALVSCRAPGIDRVGDASVLGVAHATLPREFRVATWNIQKGVRPGMVADLERLVRTARPQLVLLQEAHEGLALAPLHTSVFASSWRHPWRARSRVGVQTAAVARAINPRSQVTRRRELAFVSPKVSLITEYGLVDGRRLMAVNVHCMNFERFGTSRFRHQLERLRVEMAAHDGPIVLAGDFNTWRNKRLELLHEMTVGLDLAEVAQFPPNRSTASRRFRLADWLLGIDPAMPLDRVYYRGLDVVGATVLDYQSSDHRPLLVDFALPSDD